MNAPVDRRRIEQRLTQALSDTAERSVPAGSQPPAFSPRRRAVRGRPRWLAPLLAAAAVIVIAGSIALGMHLSGTHTPGPPVGPLTHTPTPSTSAPTSAPVTTPPGRPASAAHPATKTIDVQGGLVAQTIRLTVPESWHLSRTQPQSCCDTPPTRCLVSGRDDWANSPENCVLTVTWGILGLSPDVPYPYPADGCHRWTTTQESDPTVQGRPAEFRAFFDDCTGVASEQWTTMSGPQVAFWHPITKQSTHDVVAGVVASAMLPDVQDQDRQFDEGILTGMSVDAGTYRITIDRVVVGVDGAIINHNPATYSYQLAEGVSEAPPWNFHSLAEVYAQFRKGTHPADGTRPVDGTYIQVDKIRNAYNLDLTIPPNLDSYH